MGIVSGENMVVDSMVDRYNHISGKSLGPDVAGSLVMDKVHNKPIRNIFLVISILGSFYFLIALIVWFWFVFFTNQPMRFEGLRILGPLAAYVLLVLFVTSYKLIVKRKKYKIVLLLSIFLTIALFVFETSNHYCQMIIPSRSFNGKTSNISIAYKEIYCNWWWYEKKYPYFSEE